jgi:hypothetical protein
LTEHCEDSAGFANFLIDLKSPLFRLQGIRDTLIRTEPEVRALLETAEQLFVNATAIEKDGSFRPARSSSDKDIFVTPECSQILERISAVNHEMKTLLKVCDAYVRHLGPFIEQGSGEDGLPDQSSSGLLNLSEQVQLCPLAS